MNSRILLTLIILSFIQSANAYENEFALKAGGSVAFSHLKYIDHSEDNAGGVGFNTNFGYRFKSFEFNLTSFTAFGEMEKLTYQIGGTRVDGEGSFNHASFGPTLRYYFDVRPNTKWQWYIALGPVWSINTFKLEDFSVQSGTYKKQYRYSYNSRGWMLTIGLEEALISKDLNPAYIELLIAYQTAYQVALLDNSDFKQVLTLESDSVRTNIYTTTVMINIGLMVF
ncbi:MAG: hypothetical protein CME71_04925 [Halobacteriovorax sp.]|nr:hypothetical protein [Halobacteriovorax sp.]